MGYMWCSNHSRESWSLRLLSLSRFVSLFSLLLYYSLSVLLRCASFYLYHHFVDISDPPSIPHPTSIYRQFDGHLVHHRSQSPLSRRFIPYPHISLYLHLSLLPLLRLHPLVEDHLVPHHNPSYLSRGSLLAGVKVLSMALCVYLTKQNATTPRFSAPPPSLFILFVRMPPFCTLSLTEFCNHPGHQYFFWWLSTPLHCIIPSIGPSSQS